MLHDRENKGNTFQGGFAFGHTFGVKVDGPPTRRFLRFLRFLSLTAFQAEGCGIALSGNEYEVSVTG